MLTKKKTILAAFITLFLASAAILIYSGDFSFLDEQDAILVVEQEKEPVYLFGINTNDYELNVERVHSGQTLSDILGEYNIGSEQVHKIVQVARPVFNIERIVAGKTYTVFKTPDDSVCKAQWVVYQPNQIDYVVLDLRDSVRVSKQAKAVDVRERTAYGIVTSSLSQAVDDAGCRYDLAVELSEIYAWSVDFFRLQKGDHFRAIYDEQYIDDTTYVGMGKVKGVEFFHDGQSYFAYIYTNEDGFTEYYDDKGRSLKKAFLKAPVKFSRITSTYNPKRFHPVLKTVRPHYGTDYAAPTGTPILSTANGVIERMGFTQGNGNFVKVKHNSVYSTQYLHMSRFPKGLKVGSRVSQGDIIGYVGSTGYATGPHVCYRLWKNGVQVNPLTEKLPEAKHITEERMADFTAAISPMQNRLSNLQLAEVD